MYKDFYQFKTEPFNTHPDPGIIFVSNTHKEAWFYLLSSIDSQEPYLVLTGEYGMGKTLLCLRLIQVLSKKGKPLVEYIATPNEGYDGILRRIASSLGISVIPEDVSILQSIIYDYFRAQVENVRFYLIIDDAQELDPTTLSRLKQLSTFTHNGFFPVSIIFVAHPSFLEELKTPALLSLNQRIKRRYHLSRFSFEDTKNYINFRMVKSGASDIPAFSEASLQKIFSSSGGVPRLINNICDTCLLLGASKELTTISLSVVEQAVNRVEGSLSANGSEICPVAASSDGTGEIAVFAESVPADKDTEQESLLKTLSEIEAVQSDITHDKALDSGKRLRRIAMLTAAAFLLMSAGAVISHLFLKEGRFTTVFSQIGSSGKDQMIPKAPMPAEVDSQTPALHPAAASDPVRPEIPDPQGAPLQPDADPKTVVETPPSAGQTLLLKKDAAAPSSIDISSAEGQLSQNNENFSQVNNDPVIFPYSMRSSSYQLQSRALQELTEIRQMGLTPYLVKVDLGDMGIWWRVFIGFYSTNEEAKKVKSLYKLSNVTIQKTDFTCQIGEFTSETELMAMFEKLKQSDFFPYVIQRGKDRFQLVIGAYERKTEAEFEHNHLLKKGFKNQIVRR